MEAGSQTSQDADLYRRWNEVGVNAQRIAEALYQVTGGNGRLLNAPNFRCPQGIWGKVARIIFPDTDSTNKDRLFLYKIWVDRRKGIYDIFQSLKGKTKPQLKANPLKKRSQKPGHCFCEKAYKRVIGLVSIECDFCHRWLHTICGSVEEGSFSKNEPYKCGICRGELFVPRMFEETLDEDNISLNLEISTKVTPDSQLQETPLQSTPLGNSSKELLHSPQILEEGSDSETSSNYSESEQLETDSQNSSSDENQDDDQLCIGSGEKKKLPKTESDSDSDISLRGAFPAEKPKQSSTKKDRLSSKNDATPKESAQSESDENTEMKKPIQGDGKGISNKTEETREETAQPEGDENEVENKTSEPTDTSNIPTKFQITLLPDEWKKILKITYGSEARVTSMETTDSYTNYLYQHFRKFNQECVLAFDKKVLNPTAVKGACFKSFSHCNRKISCTAQYTIFLQKIPGPSSEATFDVELRKGKILHYALQRSRRKFTKNVLRDVQDKLKHSYPEAERLRQHKEANLDAIKAGNLSDVNTLKANQLIKTKMMAKLDRDKDMVKSVLLDMVEWRKTFPDEVVPGYVQSFGIYPLKMSLFTYRQMEVLYKIQKIVGPLTLQLDGTGNLVRTLSSPYPSGLPVLYTILLRSPGSVHSPLPIAEYITTDYTHISFYTWLYSYFEAYKKRFRITAHAYNVSKLEVDFSRPLITSAVMLMERKPLHEYINEFWKYMVKGDFENPIPLFAIHICRYHIKRALRKRFQRAYPLHLMICDRKCYDVAIDWTNAVIRARTIEHFHRRMKDIAIFASFQYQTKAVQRRIQHIKDFREEKEEGWKDFVMTPTTPANSFWSRTVFGQYADSIFRATAAKNLNVVWKIGNPSGKKYDKNPMFSEKIIRYVRKEIAPFFVLLSHSVFECCQIPTNDDTNNVIERYHGLLKTNIYKNARAQKLNRFLIRQADTIQGLTNAMDALLINKPLSKNVYTKKNPTPKANADSSSSSGSDNDAPECESRTEPQTKAHRDSESESPESQRDVFLKRKKRITVSTEEKNFVSVCPLVKGKGIYFGENGEIPLTNTCNIDSSLNLLLALYLTRQDFKDFVVSRAKTCTKTAAIARCLDGLSAEDFNNAKTGWLAEVINYDMRNSNGDMAGSEELNGFAGFSFWFPVSRFYICSNQTCYRSNPSTSGVSRTEKYEHDILNVVAYKPAEFLNLINGPTKYSTRCNVCDESNMLLFKLRFKMQDLPFFFYMLRTGDGSESTERSLPRKQVIMGRSYAVFGYTCAIGLQNAWELYSETTINENWKSKDDTTLLHYIAKVVIGKKIVVLDGLMQKPTIEQKRTNYVVTSVWLIPDNE